LSVFHICFTLVGKAKQDTGTGPSCSSFQVKVLRLFYETRM